MFFKLNGSLLSLLDKEALAQDADVEQDGGGPRTFSLAYIVETEEEVDDEDLNSFTRSISLAARRFRAMNGPFPITNSVPVRRTKGRGCGGTIPAYP